LEERFFIERFLEDRFFIERFLEDLFFLGEADEIVEEAALEARFGADLRERLLALFFTAPPSRFEINCSIIFYYTIYQYYFFLQFLQN
jgi:hypothetical protein